MSKFIEKYITKILQIEKMRKKYCIFKSAVVQFGYNKEIRRKKL